MVNFFKEYKLIVTCLIVILGLTLSYCYQLNVESKLKNSENTLAVVKWRSKALGKGHGVGVNFKIHEKVISTSMPCPCQDLEIGDTVLIKYSVEDPEVAVMVDKYYMKKYKLK
jgi:hypothetical protein